MPRISYFKSAEKSMYPLFQLNWDSLQKVRDILDDFQVVDIKEDDIVKMVLEKNVSEADAWKEVLDEAKKKYPCFAGCSLVDKEPRRIQHVIENSIAVLDVDEKGAHEIIDPLIHALGCGYIVHTSFKSRFDHMKLRYIIPLAKCVSRKDWPTLWAGMNVYFKGKIDQKCKDPTRLYFTPIRPSTTPAHEHFIEMVEGPLLDMNVFREYAKSLASIPGSGKTKVQGAHGERFIHEEGEELRDATRDELVDLAHRLKKQRTSDVLKAIGEQMARGLDGKPFGEHGERNDTMFKIVCNIADELPALDPESVASHFREAIDKMRSQGSKVTVELMAKRYDEQSAKIREKKRQEATDDAEVLAQRIAEAIPGRTTPYTRSELDAYKEMGLTDKQWIIQSGMGNGYYFFVDGTYSKPVGGEAMLTHAETMLAPAVSAGVNLYSSTTDGLPMLRPRQTLMSEYGSIAESITVDLTARRSMYNPKTKVFIEAPTPLRDIEPKEDKLIDEWLQCICDGRNESYERLLDWISVVTMLGRPASCLYFGEAAPNTGKSLIAAGLARLWGTGGPTKMKSATADFNDAITSQPLIFGDEYLPPSLMKNGTGPLREFIQNDHWNLNRKFMAHTTVKGSLRVLFAANNDGLLDSAGEAENLSAHDIEGIRQRFTYIVMNPWTAMFLKEIGGRPFINPRWIDGDGIAAHALWLRNQRGDAVYARSERFMVCGGTEKLVSNMSINTGLRGNVCHALVSFIMNPMKQSPSKQIRIENGRVLATPQGILDVWAFSLQDQRAPSLTRVAQALEGLSLKSVVVGDYRYFEVSTILLRAWADKMHYCTLDALDRKMNGQ